MATPLGNPGDLSSRAKSILEAADLILAEDTRRTGQLFARLGLSAKTGFLSFHEHNEQERLPYIIQKLLQGESLALVSDAGTPLLSDPGFKLVEACRQQQIPVSPVPGPSAPVAALSACGLPPLPYAFLGFAPRKEKEREQFFAPYANLSITLIFFERKDRLQATLATAYAILGERKGCIARELTKTYEEFIPFHLQDHATLPEELLGEMTVVLGPPSLSRSSEHDVLTLIASYQGVDIKPKDLARRIQQEAHGWSSKEIYQLLQSQRH